MHPYYPRFCIVREHARLMSYPDNCVFFGTIDSQFNQVGESVPPLLVKQLADQILGSYNELLKESI
ncbi:MAG: DNA cytosine methyltransferase [Candidatus Hodarchaeales archaeon]